MLKQHKWWRIQLLIIGFVYIGLAQGGKLKVFILAGQSNMEGYGVTWSWDNVPGPTGTLDWLLEQPEHQKDFEHLVQGYDLTANDSLIKRNDVWVAYKGINRYGDFTIPNWAVARGGKCCIGPEAGIGWELGEFYEDQVLLIKTCWGGHSLGEKFLPPSSGGPGPSYTQMVTEVNEVLADIKNFFPSYDGSGYEIVGFQWNQGWNDRNEPFVLDYETNMVNFIKDVRLEFKTPGLPFIIAETGNSYAIGTTRDGISLAQEAAANPLNYPEFKDNVAFVPTNLYADWSLAPYAGFYYHWAGSFYSYYKIGEAMGKAMIDLLPANTGVLEKPNINDIEYINNQLLIPIGVSGSHTVMLFNLKGSLIFSKDISEVKTHIFNVALPPGIYKIKVKGPNKNIKQKIIVLYK